MRLRKLRAALSPFAAASSAPLQPAQEALVLSKPHIIMILVDDVGWNQVGYRSGDGHVSTPSIDSLAQQGVKLDRVYAHFTCSPSRSSLQTGRMPIHNHLQNIAMVEHTQPMEVWGYTGAPPQYEGLGSLMRRGGYKTYAFGKWHAGMSTPAQTPAGRGYDESLVHFSSTLDGWTFESAELEGIPDLWEAGPTVSPLSGQFASNALNANGCDSVSALSWSRDGECTHLEQKLLSRAKEVIRAHPLGGSPPLFLFLAPHSKHIPHDQPPVLKACPERLRALAALNRSASPILSIPDEAVALDSRSDGGYAVCESPVVMSYLDKCVGEVVEAVQARAGMWDNTLLFFASDNGGSAPGDWSNTPLRGFKRTVWEGGIRVVAFVSGGFLPHSVQGTTQDGLMCLHDLYATFAALGNVTSLEEEPRSGMFGVDALDMSQLILGATASSPRTHVVVGNTACGEDNFHQCEQQGGVVSAVIKEAEDGRLLKIVVGDSLKERDGDGAHYAGMSVAARETAERRDAQRTACGRMADTGCLYDLEADPGEANNIAASSPRLFAAMLEGLDAHSVYPFPASSSWTKADIRRVGPFLSDPS